MKYILLTILLNASVLATHQGLPHDISEDTTEIVEDQPQQEEQVQPEEDLFADQIYDAILDEYYLPWEDEQEEVTVVEEQDNSIVVDSDFVLVAGDEIILDQDGNAYQGSSANQSDLQTSFGMLLLDMNMCAVEIIYKYNLTEAVKTTKQLVVEQNWIHNLKSARNETKVREIMAQAISPMTMQLMNANGSDLVKTMPDEVVNWMAETAILWAEENNVTDNSTDWFFEEPEVCPEPVDEVPCPQVQCAPCPMMDCTVPEACPIMQDCPEPEPFIVYEEAECACEDCFAINGLNITESSNMTEPLNPISSNETEFEDDEEYYELEDDDEYYEEEEEEEYDPKAASKAYSCDSETENCRTSKKDRSTDKSDENYNLYYKAYGYYTDYGYFSNYYDYYYDDSSYNYYDYYDYNYDDNSYYSYYYYYLYDNDDYSYDYDSYYYYDYYSYYYYYYYDDDYYSYYYYDYYYYYGNDYDSSYYYNYDNDYTDSYYYYNYYGN